MRRAAVVVVAAAVAAGVAVGAVLLAGGGAAPATTPAVPVAVRATLDPHLAGLGDALTARVVVALDRDAVRPATLRVNDDLAPLTALSAPATVRTVSGRLETVTIVQRVACMTDPCLERTISLPKVHVSVTSRGGEPSTASTSWRPLRIRSRVTPADLSRASPRFEADATPDAPSYRISPSTAATLLDVIAGLAAAGAGALLALEALAAARRRRRAVTRDELERALRLVREAERRPPPDRRRALALLARLLRSRDAGLGRAARDLAWSRPAPEPRALDELAADVERERSA
jgi:hypothetical protein